jgi:rhodanese-related sulfurtransferase
MQMERITIDALLALMRGGKQPIVIDVRSANMRALAAQAIPGAMSVILDQWQQLLPQLPYDRDIIVYCACPNEASAAVLARRLADKGYHRALPLLGGIDAWVAAGYPTEAVELDSAAPMVIPALTVPAE